MRTGGLHPACVSCMLAVRIPEFKATVATRSTVLALAAHGGVLLLVFEDMSAAWLVSGDVGLLHDAATRRHRPACVDR